MKEGGYIEQVKYRQVVRMTQKIEAEKARIAAPENKWGCTSAQ